LSGNFLEESFIRVLCARVESGFPDAILLNETGLDMAQVNYNDPLRRGLMELQECRKALRYRSASWRFSAGLIVFRVRQ